MKDEELAEEWLDERYLKDMGVRKPCKQAFLAGLKAGRPQWHDLRKNKNDLPKEFDINKNKWEMEKRITKHIVQNECGERVFCFNGTWYHEKGGEAHPIAWCEIPTFDKE